MARSAEAIIWSDSDAYKWQPVLGGSTPNKELGAECASGRRARSPMTLCLKKVREN